MAAVDTNGRTALHYAATIKDNGHFFNLLSHLGSNPKAEDNVGQFKCYIIHTDVPRKLVSIQVIINL